MNMAVLCISVPGSERRPVFASHALKHSLKFVFADAITPPDIRVGRIPPGYKVDLSDLRWTFHERFDPRRQTSPMLFTELAVTYSHISCWQWAVHANVDFLVVFEDDAEIVRPLSEEDFVQPYDLQYLSNRMPWDESGMAAGYGCGAEGYSVSRAGLFKLLKIFSVIYMPVDLQFIAHSKSQIACGHGLVEYRRKDMEEYYLDARVAPVPVCKHGSFASSIV
jgi:GR25 family glycosyltransferase involved in LPS biosynthesis